MSPPKDVINIDDTVDGIDVEFSGWDIKKTYGLIYKGNQSVNEWLQSPYVYIKANREFMWSVTDMNDYNMVDVINYYYGVANGNWSRYIEGHESFNLKKYLYVVRNLLSARIVADTGELPPTHMEDVLQSYGTHSCDNTHVLDALEYIMDTKRSGGDMNVKMISDINPLFNKLNEWIVETLRQVKAKSRMITRVDRGDITKYDKYLHRIIFK